MTRRRIAVLIGVLGLVGLMFGLVKSRKLMAKAAAMKRTMEQRLAAGRLKDGYESQRSSRQTQRDADMETQKRELLEEFTRDGQENWQKWFDQLASFRAEAHKNMGSRPFPWTDNFLFSSHTRRYLDKADLEDQAGESNPFPAIVHTVRHFQERGIDIIFVPIPNAWDVYPDKAVANAPVGRRVAPQVCRLMTHLLDEDVEVLDLLPAFLKARDHTGDWLFLPTDTHYTNRGLRLAAQEIARRLARYNFPRQEEFTTRHVSVEVRGYGANITLIPEDRRKQLYGEKIFTDAEQVHSADGQVYQDPAHSPILVIGDSFNDIFEYFCPGTGLTAHIAKELGVRPARIAVSASTTEGFSCLMREQKHLLPNLAVIVWIVADFNLYDRPWKVLSFPAVPH